MKYIIFYAALEDNDYIPSYRIAYLACNFSVFELGENVTKEFVDKMVI